MKFIFSEEDHEPARLEPRRLAREKIYGIDPGVDDYQLHVLFIEIARRQDLISKVLHNYLEKKYRQETRKFFVSGSGNLSSQCAARASPRWPGF